jgi:hypothetical protein
MSGLFLVFRGKGGQGEFFRNFALSGGMSQILRGIFSEGWSVWKRGSGILFLFFYRLFCV